jgi:crotonobetainyl-CoA:carnitine CoA-transferase CaiB-like acyl-CoA transferase
MKLSATPGGVRSPAPLWGEHTEQVLREVLGYDEARVASLQESEALS